MGERLTKVRTATLNVWRALLQKHAPRYRPEAHYMRGPGPKWRAKHAAVFNQR
jgi:hypothetical protein